MTKIDQKCRLRHVIPYPINGQSFNLPFRDHKNMSVNVELKFSQIAT